MMGIYACPMRDGDLKWIILVYHVDQGTEMHVMMQIELTISTYHESVMLSNIIKHKYSYLNHGNQQVWNIAIHYYYLHLPQP